MDTRMAPSVRTPCDQARGVHHACRALRLGTPDLSSLDAARVLIRFADMEKVSAWAFADVATCVEVGIVQGRDAGNLAPEESVTRAEAAVMVARFWKK